MSNHLNTTKATNSEKGPGIVENQIQRSFITIITPACNEAENLPVLYQRLRGLLDNIDGDWEWIVVDDHSSDQTLAVLNQLAEQDGRLRGFRFSRNFGSYTAITCGLNHARGDCAIVMASDLQDPPEKIPDLLAQWQHGAQVVWATRARREGQSAIYLSFARLYYNLMRHTSALRDLPPTGADFFLLDRCVIDAFNQFQERHVSVEPLITWMGFRQAAISYTKEPRLHGRSGWNLKKKLKLVVDSITSFSYLPIRLMSYIGFIIALTGFLYIGFVVADKLRGTPTPGWASLMVVTLILGGVNMIMLGILGEYLWRALDEGRRRPRYVIETTIGQQSPKKQNND